MTIVGGTKIGRYEIRSKLGEGGMGEVYLANDTQLDRKVAIKFLPAGSIANEQANKRLRREATTAAKLDHPNICSIYEVGEADGRSFIVMQYVEGETLDVRLKRKPLDLSESLSIATQVADGLAEAHAKGIIHRDIKPSNIIITERGHVKVMDFGLAKSSGDGVGIDTEAETQSFLTTPGAIVGTVPYMSPEQVHGQAVDARSDIFSFGVVLYEMLTGRQPFVAESGAATIAGILTKEPLPLVHYVPLCPEELQRITCKCLEKDRERRYQTGRDMLIDLRNLKQASESGSLTSERVAKPSRHVLRRAFYVLLATLIVALAVLAIYVLSSGNDQAIDSLAVLPFVNGGANPDTDYLSDGITDDLINRLSQLPKLKVMSRNSVFRYKGTEADAQQAGLALGVRAVLTGKVTQRGDELIVSAELVDVRDNSHLWGDQYERKLSDILAVQEELSSAISENLRLKLSGEDKQRLTKRGTQDAEAYELYLKGRYYLNTLSPEGQKSLAYFQRAIEIDPRYAAAYAGLAQYYVEAVTVGATFTMSPKEAFSKAKEAASKAVELDDTLAEAHTSLAAIAMKFEWDWTGAEREFKRAIALNPNYVPAHHLYSHYLINMGRFEESLAESQRALALDPLDVGMNLHLGFHYFAARQYDQAVAQFQKTLEMNPNHSEAHNILGLVYEQQGRYQEAIAEMQKGRELGGTDDRSNIAHVYAISGQRGEAQKLLDELQEEAKHKYVSPYSIAIIYEGLGEKDQAFAWLEKAYAERDGNITDPGLKVDPELDRLHSDARFAYLLGRIGLPQ